MQTIKSSPHHISDEGVDEWNSSNKRLHKTWQKRCLIRACLCCYNVPYFLSDQVKAIFNKDEFKVKPLSFHKRILSICSRYPLPYLRLDALVYLFEKQKTPRRVLLVYIYRFDHCGAFLAFLRPNFLRSFARESRVRSPSFLRVGRSVPSCFSRARARPCRTA